MEVFKQINETAGSQLKQVVNLIKSSYKPALLLAKASFILLKGAYNLIFGILKLIYGIIFLPFGQ